MRNPATARLRRWLRQPRWRTLRYPALVVPESPCLFPICLAAADCLPSLFLSLSCALRFPLVVHFFATGHSKLAFDVTILHVKLQWNQRETFLSDFFLKLVNLAPMQQKLALPH